MRPRPIRSCDLRQSIHPSLYGSPRVSFDAPPDVATVPTIWYASRMTTTFDRFDQIVADPEILDGQPRLRGTRITVRRVLDLLATNPSWDDLRADYPEIGEEQLRQVLCFAAAHLTDRVVPIPASDG